MTTPSEVYQNLVNQGHKKVKVAITDLDGVLRGKYIHIDKLKSAIEGGLGFCNVVFGWDVNDETYDKSSYTGWHSGFPDAKVRLDLSTLRNIPWDNNTPFILGDFEDSSNNQALEVCPRQTLKRVNKALNKLGYNAKVGVEFEWFNFKETPKSIYEKNFKNLEHLSPGMFGYSVLRSSLNSEFFNCLLNELNDFNIPIEGLHTETGPGVLEAAILACEPVEAGDRGVLFKTATKEISNRLGIMSCFMARWSRDFPGCGGHLHMSLKDSSGNPIFYDDNSPNKMSETFKSFLAGQIEYLPQLLPMFAPTINSYKRLVEGFWAPTRTTWGIDNRTVALRVLNQSPPSSRVEVRIAGADMNTYLAIAASLGAGLLGIEQKLQLKQQAITGNGYVDKESPKLADNLKSATEEFQRSEIAQELFSKKFVEHFSDSRMCEWERSQKAVTDWELNRYFEII